MHKANTKYFTSLLFFSCLAALCFAGSQGPFSGESFSNLSISGSVSTWSNTGNCTTTDQVYATNTSDLPNAASYSDYLKATNFGFAIPSNVNTIDGISVEVICASVNAKARDYSIKIIKGNAPAGTDHASSAWQNSDGVHTYGGANDLWGEAWTKEQINSQDFGIAISIIRNGTAPHKMADARVDDIRITVYYTILSPLPVKLLTFNASAADNKALLSWTTATEINSDYFTIEKSKDMINFSEVRRVQGAGNTTSTTYYSAVDAFPSEGLTYYHLQEVDYDGHPFDLGIVKVIIPNKNEPIKYPLFLTIQNTEGKTIFSSEINDDTAIKNLKRGFYFLTEVKKDEIKVIKYFKD